MAGMDVARLNFSHGTLEEHAATIRNIRDVAGKLGRPVGVLQDLPGPKIRTGQLATPSVQLVAGAQIILTTDAVIGDNLRVPVTLPSLPEDVHPGDTIFVDDGALRLQVERVEGHEVLCTVIVGGLLKPEKGINVPGVSLSTPSITETDWRFLRFGLYHGVDFVALSFIRRPEDVSEVRARLVEWGAQAFLIGKIEKHEALENIDAIIERVDGIMVARGDLGVEIPIEKVPIAQKALVRKCNRVGKPVIVATQMLESMIHAPLPTRAEVTDVANAIFDGADAVMLSAETAIGEYPVETVQMMVRIARETEAALPYSQMLAEFEAHAVSQTDDAIAYSACHATRQLDAAAIVAFTTSGSTARRVAKYRPQAPILAITTDPKIERRLALTWGVRSKVVSSCSLEEMFAIAPRAVREAGLACPGQLVVITAGFPSGSPGATNLLRVAKVEDQ
jgi:pyruvate kinase